MKINYCSRCGSRHVTDIVEDEVKVKCSVCGQELGRFFRVCETDDPHPLTAKAELYECPYCGTEARFFTAYRIHSIECKECGSRTLRYYTQDEAIEAWQKRYLK